MNDQTNDPTLPKSIQNLRDMEANSPSPFAGTGTALSSAPGTSPAVYDPNMALLDPVRFEQLWRYSDGCSVASRAGSVLNGGCSAM